MLQLGLGKHPGSPLHILCMGAHSDDVEIGCGGTLLRLLDDHPGSHVTWVVFSASATRAAEAQTSAAAFLARAGQSEVQIHAYKESYFPSIAADIKDTFERLKSATRPDVVFAHRHDDMHQDHRVIAELTWNTFRNHLVLQYEIPKYEGDLGQPNVFVPLPMAVAQRKVDLLQHHFESQRHRSWFHADTFHGLMSVRGVECNAPERRAEAFYARKLVL